MSVPSEFLPPSSTWNREVRLRSNVTIAGSDASDGFAGSALKSVGTFTFRVEMAYSASFSGKTPASRCAKGAIWRLDAPTTASSSYTLPPLITSPSTSKKVVNMRSNAGSCSCEPAYTNLKSNSTALIAVGVPSRQSAVEGSSSAPEKQYDLRRPKPRHTNPESVNKACEVVGDIGLQYSMSTSSL
jgi:hypothetical protein